MKASSATIITSEMLARLPVPVRKYLEFSGVVGKPFVRKVVIRQTGRIRLAPQKPWMLSQRGENVFHFLLGGPHILNRGWEYRAILLPSAARSKFVVAPSDPARIRA